MLTQNKEFLDSHIGIGLPDSQKHGFLVHPKRCKTPQSIKVIRGNGKSMVCRMHDILSIRCFPSVQANVMSKYLCANSQTELDKPRCFLGVFRSPTAPLVVSLSNPAEPFTVSVGTNMRPPGAKETWIPYDLMKSRLELLGFSKKVTKNSEGLKRT